MQRSVEWLKHTLRQLKKLEIMIRFGDCSPSGNQRLVWDVFFSTKEDNVSVKYPLQHLLELDRQGIKQVVEEYFYRIYIQNYQDKGLTAADVYDPKLLSLLGLPAYAGSQDIKKRFRELAKKYHPDRGGDSSKFIELVEIYERLM